MHWILVAFALFDYAGWDALLKKYVDGAGRVNYDKLRGDGEDRRRLDALAAQVAAEKLDGLAPRAREALLIDAYNVLVVKNVVESRPGRVDEGLYKFFRRDFVVAGRTVDLDTLEKKWIRPAVGDPRVHVALNCASAGCPELPPEAFTPEKLEEQLEREARKFCGEKRNVDFDPVAKRARISKIFDWYAKDFGDRPIEWINRYRKEKIPVDAKIEFVEWDWRLNDPSLKR